MINYNGERPWWAPQRTLDEEVLLLFEKEGEGSIESFEKLSKFKKLNKDFVEGLDKKNRQKFAELEDCLKEFLRLRASDLIFFTAKLHCMPYEKLLALFRKHGL